MRGKSALKLHHILLIFLISFFPEIKAEGGSSAYDFLNIPQSSYVMGMGSVNVSSLQPDLDLASQNPALIGQENDKQLKLGYMYYYGNSNFAGIRYGMKAGLHGAWAAGIRYLNYGNFRGFDHTGEYTGDFTAQDIVFEGTYSHDFTYRLRGGINVKMIYSAYEGYNAFAMAADLGLTYYDERHDISFGLVLKNMGGQLKRFEDRYNRLPFDIQLGISKAIGSNFSFSITAYQLTKWRLPYYVHEEGEESLEKEAGFFRNLFRHLVFGVEYTPNDLFYLDLGYNYNIRCSQSGYQRNFLSGFSIGGGLNIKSFSLGLGYALPHKGGSTLLLNLGLDIDSLLQ